MIDLESMNLTELKALAKEHNIKNISKLKKDEIIEVLNQFIDNTSNIKRNNETTAKKASTSKVTAWENTGKADMA